MNKTFNKTKNMTLRALGILFMFSAVMAFTGCASDDDPIFTASEDDSPRILNTDLHEWTGGLPNTVKTLTTGTNLTYDVIVTPDAYTKVEWFLDGQKVHEGKSIDTLLLAGTYDYKIEATTTKGLSTYRIARVQVDAPTADPRIVSTAAERVMSSGTTVTLTGGVNLDKVAKMLVGGKEVTNLNIDGDGVTFTVPQLSDGDYRIVLVDAAGKEYGSNAVTISTSPIVTSQGMHFEGDKGTLEGINLQSIQSIKIGDKEVTIAEQSANSLTFTYSDIAGGDYTMTATDKAGNPVHFLATFATSEQVNVTVLQEFTVWEGSHNLEWAAFDEASDKIAAVAKPGVSVIVYCTINKSDYHQVRFMNKGWGVFPEYPNDYHWDGDMGESNRIVIELTQADCDLIAANGFAMAGWGVEITRVAYK